MQFISNFLRASRFRLFAAATENRVLLLSLEDRAAALVHAVDYCLHLRRHEGGTLISMALLDPGQLGIHECKEIFYDLETPYFQLEGDKIPNSEVSTVCRLHGKGAGEEYKRITEALFHRHAVGLGILMTRLSYRVARLKAQTNTLHESPSAYTRIAGYLRESRPHIHAAVEQRNSIVEMSTPDQWWSPETVHFARKSAEIMAMTFPG